MPVSFPDSHSCLHFQLQPSSQKHVQANKQVTVLQKGMVLLKRGGTEAHLLLKHLSALQHPARAASSEATALLQVLLIRVHLDQMVPN